MKRLTIIKRNYLARGMKGWYNETSAFEILKDKTDKQIDKCLEEVNKRKREHKWEVAYKYDFKTRAEKERFIKDVPQILEDLKKDSWNKKDIKEIAKNIIEEL